MSEHIRMTPLRAVDLEQLMAIHNLGPTWDGDLISKEARDILLNAELVERVISAGQEGYQACTLRGRALLRAYQEEIGRVKFQ